ncbi:phage portal protein [Pseudoduganella sp. UC29_106]|uniref:phage portal protein n=1 Tax=Pseudoduganella sp. UC29_106 TaxID=3374553 RepID=UPI003757C5AE
MRVFGLDISIRKAALTPVRANSGWFGIIRESYAGAFQSHVEVDAPRDLLSYSGLYAPVTLIAGDIAKLRLKMTERQASGIWTEVESGSPFLPVLRKPNTYQTRIQFVEFWMLMKILYGNAYILKVRDNRNMVIEMHVLDSERVLPLVAPNGDVYYQISADFLAGLQQGLTVPASEIIHDRMNCLWHPLVGIAPIYAAALSATQGRKIQNNSAKFFENMSRPSGMLTSPNAIDDETALRLKTGWEENYAGGNLGRLAVAGSGLEYKAFTIPAEQAQLIEQLEWTVKDIARALLVPQFMVGGATPSGSSVEAETLRYYTQCLQKYLEQAEACLDDGLALLNTYRTEFDTEGLIRMDSVAQIEVLSKATGGGIMAPNEARYRMGLPPVAGGDTPYLQQQNYSLEALAKRDAQTDPFGNQGPAATPGATPTDEPAPADDAAAKQAQELIEKISKGLQCQ